MNKAVLKIVCISFFFSFSCLAAKKMVVEDLHIFRIFQNSKAILIETVLQRGNANVDFEKQYLKIVDQEIVLLNEIVYGFNEGLLSLFEYKFWGICNFFKDLDSIEPRNVRAFKRKITKFDDFVQKWCLSKLNDREIELKNKLISFDKILLEYFLRHDFYNIGAFDKVKDLFFYRPVEWAGEHPIVTASIFLIIGGFLFYYYVWPNIDFFDEEKKDGYVLIKNHNQKVTVIQLKQEKTQSWLTCGAHATFNLIAMIKGRGDPKKIYELMNDQTERQACFQRWQAIVPDKNGLNRLDGNDIERILRAEDIGDVTVVEDSALLQEANFPQFNHMAHFIDGKYVYVADSLATGELGPREFIDVDGSRKIRIEEEVVGERVPAFRAGQSQFFIVNTAQRTDLTNDGGLGHWLPFFIAPSRQERSGATIFTADSSWNSNRTNSWILNRLHSILIQ